MQKLSKLTLSRLALRQNRSTGHPDANLLSAFAEQSASARDRSEVLGHLAQCQECREVVALLSMPGEVPQIPSLERTIPVSTWWKLRWAAAFAVACLVLVVVWHPPVLPPATPTAAAPRPVPQPTPEGVATHLEPPQKAVSKPIVRASHRVSKTMPPPRVTPPVQMAIAPPPPPTIESPVPFKQLEIQPTPQSFIAPPPADAGALTRVSQLDDQQQLLRQRSAQMLQEKASVARLRSAQQQAKSFTANGVSAKSPRSMMSGVFQRVPLVPGAASIWSLAAPGDNGESGKGIVQRSDDNGKTWNVVHVDDQSRLYAVAVNGPEVWAGGENGALFHSLDNGSHWTPVIVAGGGKQLTASITRIDIRNDQYITLKVTSGGNWSSLDGGFHWRTD